MAKNFPIKFADTFKKSAQIFSRVAVSLYLIFLYFAIPAVSLVYSALFGMSLNTGAIGVVGQLMVLLLLVLIILPASLLNSAATIISISKAFHGKESGVFESYKEAIKNFSIYLKITSLYCTKVMLWSIVFILPGIYFAVVYSWAPILVLLEGEKPKSSFERSARLIKTHLAKYLDYILFVFILSVIMCIPFIVTLDFLIDWCVQQEYWKLVQLLDFAEVSVMLLAVQFIAVFYYVMYEEMKRREETSAA